MTKRPPPGVRRPAPEPADASAPRLLVIVGPTASGKTSLGVTLARALGGEVVSADSQLVYRGLDIATAKPAPAERQGVPHHLIDVAEPTESLSAGDFVRLADERIAELSGRGRLPVVVGGTGLWVRALLFGMIDAPPADAALRAGFEERARAEGREALHAELARLDPETAAGIPPANLVRVIRALEIHALTGETPSALRRRHGFARLRYRAKVLGLQPPREELYRRVDARVREMYAAGLLDEVRGLLARGLREAPALRSALGYAQALEVVEGRWPVEKAVEETAKATRHYAKRQGTWFRAEPIVEWLPWPVDAAALIERLRNEGWRSAD